MLYQIKSKNQKFQKFIFTRFLNIIIISLMTIMYIQKKLYTYLFLLQYIFFKKTFENKNVNNKFIPISPF